MRTTDAQYRERGDLRELLEVYAQHGSAAALPRVTPYRDYLTFIAGQDRADPRAMAAAIRLAADSAARRRPEWR